MVLDKATLLQAITYIRQRPATTPGMLQRRFKIGYFEACQVLDGTHALLTSHAPPAPRP